MKRIDAPMCKRQLQRFESVVGKHVETDAGTEGADSQNAAEPEKNDELSESDDEGATPAHDVALRKRLRRSSNLVEALFSDSD